MAGFSIETPSKSRRSMAIPWACGLVVAAVAGIWCFTHWIPAELERHALAGAGAIVVLGTAAFLFGRRGTPRGGGGKLCWTTLPAGEIDLIEVESVRIDTGDRTFLIVPREGKPISVPDQCVQDLWSIASELASKQPQIRIYVDANRIAPTQ